MRVFAGVDGGGTRTTVGLADEQGREIARSAGAAGLVDPRDPMASAATVASLVRRTAQAAGISAPITALCAGLAGVGSETERRAVEAALQEASIAGRVGVISDGEIALEGALGGGPGILLLAGTGSVAHARAPDGRFERCGGWGMILGDEGSGYGIARAALIAAVRAVDGRGEATRLLPTVLDVLDLPDADELPPWIGRAPKSEVAALTVHVLRLAGEGDAVARQIVERGADDLVAHAVALVCRLQPWPEPTRVVCYGGILRQPLMRDLLARALKKQLPDAHLVDPVEDAVAGALRYARKLALT